MYLPTLQKHILLAMRVLTRDDSYSLVSRSDLGAFAFGGWNDARQAALQALIKNGYLDETRHPSRICYYSLTEKGLCVCSPNRVAYVTSLLA
jgi:hypothetical protein